MLRDHGISVVLAAGDTHRAGAIEQIMYHGNNLNVKVISQRYGADPSAVARDALEHAKKNYVEVVLIDTAGRMQTSKNLMEEVSKIIRVIKPDMRIFVGDSLAGNDTVNQAREFFEYTKFDGSILTKSDADSRGGAAISITYLTHKPILYLGIGQGYDDLDKFDHERYLNSIFKGRVYEKSTYDEREQHASNADSSRINELTENANIDSPTHMAIDDSTNKDTDKYVVDEEAISTPTAIMSEANDIGNQDQLIAEQLNDDKEHRKGGISKETSETKPKKGSFFNKLFKDGKENDLVDSNTQSQADIRTRRDKNKEKTESKNESEEVVYLTDDDINDLLK
jgi:fused signal recognition particle receptor